MSDWNFTQTSVHKSSQTSQNNYHKHKFEMNKPISETEWYYAAVLLTWINISPNRDNIIQDGRYVSVESFRIDLSLWLVSLNSAESWVLRVFARSGERREAWITAMKWKWRSVNYWILTVWMWDAQCIKIVHILLQT